MIHLKRTPRLFILALAAIAFVCSQTEMYAEETKKKAKRKPALFLKVPKKDAICFAMYTVQDKTLKLVAQLYPLAAEDSRSITLEIEKNGKWEKISEGKIREDFYEYPTKETKAWNTLFRVENWDHSQEWKYRVVALDGVATYTGIIRKDPIDKNKIVVAAFTGNSKSERGLKPDIIANIKAQDPDLLFFSGDQSYDHKNHLGAWLLFGRQFGEIIKDRPTIAIPDDHDVGQPNIWGENGVKSHIKGAADGGYVLSPQYVNEVQFAQTANLPDPYDSTPIKQGIGVYYTDINVGGIDFAILEDRKFKTGPDGIIPKMGPRPDHINDPKYDRKSVDVPEAKLLGERQLKFLDAWGKDWKGAEMKAILSQTIFCGGAHIHAGGRLLADLDSNGWPQTGRNKALKTIRKSFAVMIAGDQHLASIFHHGVDDWNDSGFSFCVPSICSGYPRAWHPLEKGINPVTDQLEHTGEYLDGFGNKVTAYAYANPKQHKNPLIRASAGYGLVIFNKKERAITLECWPRLVDVTKPDVKQFPGWPLTIKQEDNYPRKAVAYLPEIEVIGMLNPVVQVIDESNNEVVYTIRIKGHKYLPKVFKKGLYTLVVGDQQNREKIIKNIQAGPKTGKIVQIKWPTKP